MKIFITGSEGFLGKELVAQCKARGFEVVCIDIVDSAQDNYHKVDINSKHIINLLPEDTDVVIHLAGMARDKDCEDNDYNCFQSNVMGSLNLINAAKIKGVKQFIFASSEWVYGEHASPKVLKETDKTNFNKLKSVYALSKLVTESNLHQRFEQGFCPVTILRFSIIYGPRTKNWSAVESLLSQVKNKNEVEVGSLETGRCFINVADVATGIIKSIGLKGFEIINLGSEQLITLGTILSDAQIVLNKTIKIHEKYPKQVSIRNVSIKKAKTLLGWEPKISLREGLKEIIPFV